MNGVTGPLRMLCPRGMSFLSARNFLVLSSVFQTFSKDFGW